MLFLLVRCCCYCCGLLVESRVTGLRMIVATQDRATATYNLPCPEKSPAVAARRTCGGMDAAWARRAVNSIGTGSVAVRDRSWYSAEEWGAPCSGAAGTRIANPIPIPWESPRRPTEMSESWVSWSSIAYRHPTKTVTAIPAAATPRVDDIAELTAVREVTTDRDARARMVCGRALRAGEVRRSWVPVRAVRLRQCNHPVCCCWSVPLESRSSLEIRA